VSRNSSVGIALGYRLDDRGSRIRFPAGAGNFSLHHCVQNGSGAHPASYPRATRGSFPGGEAAGAWSWPLTSIYCQDQRMSGAIPPLPQYAFMAWCLFKRTQGQLYLYLCTISRQHDHWWRTTPLRRKITFTTSGSLINSENHISLRLQSCSYSKSSSKWRTFNLYLPVDFLAFSTK
jgi:hypothetical protein